MLQGKSSRKLKLLILLCLAVYTVALVNLFKSDQHYNRKINDRQEELVYSGDDDEFNYTDDYRKALEFVTPNVVNTWRARSYLVALGIPSPDNEERRQRRELQRATCWKFPEVATVRNNFSGKMLVAYVLAKHPQYDYEYSVQLMEEARSWRDVITLPIHEGRVTTKKKVGQVAHWGIEAEIGMSRKVFLWFELAVRLLPRTSYFSKGDDDAFFHVPQYIVDLDTLPRRAVYWAFHWRIGRERKYIFGRGLLYTMARDVVEKFISFAPVRRLINMSFSYELKPEFIAAVMDYEDAMVGNALSHQHPEELLFVNESCCRFIILNGNECKPPQHDDFVVIHGIEENEYGTLMNRLNKKKKHTPVKFVPSKFGTMAKCPH
uniref:Hexosyltransferase n=1 Tax=Trypanosoma congolense (strain IL3000) TaxID=1068625 RepID=G0UKM0_TRYCI|nr:putative UDP-Gal or UDP-GlcNAc-dependent glycosyltransferase [Trypanosoma congolense IL3000]